MNDVSNFRSNSKNTFSGLSNSSLDIDIFASNKVVRKHNTDIVFGYLMIQIRCIVVIMFIYLI